MKSHHYSQHAAALRTELGRALPRETLMALHTKTPARHLLVAARQFAILGLCTWGLVTIANPQSTVSIDTLFILARSLAHVPEKWIPVFRTGQAH